VAAFDEEVEFCFRGGEVPDACTHVGELAADQGRHISTGDVAMTLPISASVRPAACAV